MLDPKIHTLLTLEELGSYTRAAQALPLTPQLAPAEQRASTENREFQI